MSEAERYQHSERLALCRYRLFTIAISEKNVEENVKAALIFEGFVDRLDKGDQLEAIRQLINVWMAERNWKKVNLCAKQLLQLATIQYNQGLMEKKSKHPVYFYVLYSWLIQSVAHAEVLDYKSALKYVSEYAHGESWIREQDETAKWYINQFSEWATANTYLYEILTGNEEALVDYARYVESKPDEIFIAINLILDGLKISVKINSVRNMVNALTLFEKFRIFATSEEKMEFQQLSSEVNRLNAEKHLASIN
ncbi:hypothetical protein D3C77_502620 [compost metagenome]